MAKVEIETFKTIDRLVNRNPYNDKDEVKIKVSTMIKTLKIAIENYLQDSENAVNFAKMMEEVQKLPTGPTNRQYYFTNVQAQFIEKFNREHPNIKIVTVRNVYKEKLDLSRPLYGGRQFLFNKVDGRLEKFNTLKEEFKNLRGDELKESIIADFKRQIEKTNSLDELKNLKLRLQGSTEYKALATGQKIITWGRTDSVIAFDAMFEERSKQIKSRAENKGPSK